MSRENLKPIEHPTLKAAVLLAEDYLGRDRVQQTLANGAYSTFSGELITVLSRGEVAALVVPGAITEMQRGRAELLNGSDGSHS